MNSLESVRTFLEDYLQESATSNDFMRLLLIFSNKDFIQRVYDAFFNLIADSTQTPEDIALKIDAYISGLESFPTNGPLQCLVAYACLESLARRKPKVSRFNGPCEKLLWSIVNMKKISFCFCAQNDLVLPFKKTNIDIVHWTSKKLSQKACPNPCLRLELLGFIRTFNGGHVERDQKSFRDNLIIALLELSDNYTSLTINQLPNFCPEDLQMLMQGNNISMGYLMNDYDLYMKKTKIIVSVLKLTRLFALLEKEKQSLNSTYFLKDKLSVCLSFCGLLPDIPEDDWDDEYCIQSFIQELSNDPLLMNYLMETLDTINQVSMCSEDEEFEKDIRYLSGRMLHRFFKSYINKFPKHQYLQEIYGGHAPAKVYSLRFIQNNMIGKEDRDSDLDSDSEYL